MDLYREWLNVAGAAPKAVALVETASERTWRFIDLQRAGEKAPPAEQPICHVGGHTSDFLIRTLAAWRDGAVVSPCEDGEPPCPISALPNSVCHIKRTSGSTGTPRAVWFTAKQLNADVDHIVSTMGLRSDWPNIGALSLAHSYGFSNLVLPLLLYGIPLVLVPDALPTTVKRAIDQHAAVTLPGVPAMWRAWLGGGVLDERVRLAISAGAPLTVDLERAVYESAGVKIHNFYGSTECGGIAYDRSPEPRTDPAYVGTALDGVTLEVLEGRLEVRSAAVALGYDADDDSVAVLGTGRFYTADRVEIDAGGRVFLRGRHGEAMNVAGRKLAPQVVEEVLLSLSGVRHAVVFGVPSKDTERVDDIVAVIRLNGQSTLEKVTGRVAEKLPAWQRPRFWWECQSLEPDVRGKISRLHWRQLYLNRGARG